MRVRSSSNLPFLYQTSQQRAVHQQGFRLFKFRLGPVMLDLGLYQTR